MSPKRTLYYDELFQNAISLSYIWLAVVCMLHMFLAFVYCRASCAISYLCLIRSLLTSPTVDVLVWNIMQLTDVFVCCEARCTSRRWLWHTCCSRQRSSSVLLLKAETPLVTYNAASVSTCSQQLERRCKLKSNHQQARSQKELQAERFGSW